MTNGRTWGRIELTEEIIRTQHNPTACATEVVYAQPSSLSTKLTGVTLIPASPLGEAVGEEAGTPSFPL